MRFWSSLLLYGVLHICQSVYGSLIDDLVNAITQAVDCGSCHAFLVPLKGLAALGNSPFSDTMAAVCKLIGAEDDDVCDGTLAEQGPIVAHDLRKISPFDRSSTLLCNSIFGLCQQPAVQQLNFPLSSVPENQKQWTSQGRQPFQVVHFSDVHIDREYTPGAEVNCTKPICCRNYTAELPIQQPAGILASHNCDASTGLVESMLRAASAQGNSFSIFTGDVIEGDVWLVNQTGVTAHLQQFNQEMQTFIGTPVFPVIGNHDVAPVNSFPRNTTSDASSQWVFDTQGADWSAWLDASAIDAVKHVSGSYSAVVSGTNLRIISLNNLYWYKANFWLFDSDAAQPDPNGILAFAAQELQAAEDAGQRAWIIAHMPPSSSDALYDQSNYFDQIVQRYKNTIAGQFYGHTHKDEFAISYSDYTNRTAVNAVSTMWIVPSLTPSTGNPAFRVYDVDPDTYEIMDARVFIGDLADPTFQTSPQWKQYYSAREIYGSALSDGWPENIPLTPAFWHQVTEAFEKNDALFQQFLEFKWRGVHVEICQPGQCKEDAICALRAGRSEDNCVVASPSLSFRKRDPGERSNSVAVNDCEGTGLGTIFSDLPSKMVSINVEEFTNKLKSAIPEFNNQEIGSEL